MDGDTEILQDFLVESGEILEKLGEQLVELEARPDDNALLNAVFRGFHTIKGGASFLALTTLVEVCHRAEDVFNTLRQGARKVDAALMDVVLQVLDSVNLMHEAVRLGEEPVAAGPELLARLDVLARPAEAEAPVAEVQVAQPASGSGDSLSDGDYKALLDTLYETPPAQTAATGGASPAAASGDEITDNEFEALLDQLHGKGQPQEAVAPVTAPAPPPAPAAPPARAAAPDEITEAEFDALLDQLQGQGKKAAPAVAAARKEVAPVAKAEGEHVAAAAAETTVRVDTKRIDDIMNMVGELVLVRNRLVTLEASLSDEETTKAVANLDVVTASLQTAVMKTRMQPIKKVFGRFPRVVRDLARSLNKEVTLELQGEDTDLDKNLVEALADPLVHLVRNAVDHGIEMPDKRVAAGKPRGGTVLLTAAQEGDHILLTIADDGGGIDHELLRRKVVEKGLMDAEAAARLDQTECYNLIFMPGFSTKEEISDVSGRGVGMDVVKTRIAQLNGVIEIESAIGAGTRLVIKVPLTLAIMPTLMVMLANQIFALPLVSVNEIFNLDLTRTNNVDGQLTVMVRDRALPLFYLREWLVSRVHRGSQGISSHVVIVNIGIQRVGLVVDQLVGQEEVVVKPLGTMLHGTLGLSGATITGDGRIALILDVPGLMKAYARRA
ncbi:MAG: chemotaxis protein CheA [Gammaproteobacteria bacterium]|nr:chemotaxis protein CheA [Gammaproteobacteria bacterium]